MKAWPMRLTLAASAAIGISSQAFGAPDRACLANLPAGATLTCDCALKVLGSTAEDLASGNHVYRQLPTLTPNSRGNLNLDLTLTAPYKSTAAADPGKLTCDGVFIGKYCVSGAPVMLTRPTNGSAAYILDVVSGRSFGVPAACLQRPELAYAGARWKLNHGQSIKLKFASAMSESEWKPEPNRHHRPAGSTLPDHVAPAVSSNLHTHGAVVAPTPGSATKPYGDYIFDVAAPASSMACANAVPGSMQSMHQPVCGDMNYRIPIPPRKPRMDKDDPLTGAFHPSGLFWVHPHPHGYSRVQLNGGVSSLLTVGALEDYVRIKTDKLRNVRHLQLKDAQLEGVTTPQVGAPPMQSAKFRASHGYDPKLCQAANTTFHPGECRVGAEAWVFTVSGMQYPKFSIGAAGKPEVWRIANASPNVTYSLSLLRVAGADGATLPTPEKIQFGILAVDGVSIGENDIAARAGTSPGEMNAARNARPPATRRNDIIREKIMIMMPGTRAELLLEAMAPGRYVLRQMGFDAGGDQWPEIDLAELTVDEAIPTGTARVSNPPEVAKPATVEPTKLKPACLAGGLAPVRRIAFVKWTAPTNVEHFGLIAGVHEKTAGKEDADNPIVFYDDAGAKFPGIADMSQAWNELINGKNAPKVVFGDNPINSVCSYPHRDELWVLENWTTEVHNFHIHQSRFKLALDKLCKQPQAPGAPCERDARYFLMPASPPVADATPAARARATLQSNTLRDLYAQILPKTAGADDPSAKSWGSAHHDSVPIPRAVGAGCNDTPAPGGECTPGRITVRISFRHQNQIGRFVYHCHILEHEDNGMMAAVEVCDPNNPSATCKTPPQRSGALAPPSSMGGAHRH